MVVQGVVALVKDSFAKVNMDGLRIQGFLHRSKYPGTYVVLSITPRSSGFWLPRHAWQAS